VTLPVTVTTFLRGERLPGRYRLMVFLSLLAISISRAPYLLLHGRFFAEEGSVYFAHAKVGSAWFVGSFGYIHAFCNASTWLAARVPIERAPLVTAWLSLGAVVAVAWAALSLPSDLLPTAGSRIAAAALLVVGPLAAPVVWLNTINVQVYLGILALLFLFVDVSAIRRTTIVVMAVVLGLAGLSGLYAAILFPLFVFLAVRERTRRRIMLASVISLCALVQFLVVWNTSASGDLAQGRGSFPGPGGLTRDVAAKHMSTFLFGQSISGRLLSHAHTVAGILGFALFGLFVVVVLGSLLAFAPRAEVALLLVAAFALVEIMVLFGARQSAGGRYAVVPIAILLLIAVYATTGRNQVAAGIAAALCLVTFVTGLSTFWTSQAAALRCRDCPAWSRQVSAWQSGKTNQLVIWPYWLKSRWVITLPHHRPEPANAQRRPADDGPR
jgi:hypothetical protein